MEESQLVVRLASLAELSDLGARLGFDTVRDFDEQRGSVVLLQRAG